MSLLSGLDDGDGQDTALGAVCVLFEWCHAYIALVLLTLFRPADLQSEFGRK